MSNYVRIFMYIGPTHPIGVYNIDRLSRCLTVQGNGFSSQRRHFSSETLPRLALKGKLWISVKWQTFDLTQLTHEPTQLLPRIVDYTYTNVYALVLLHLQKFFHATQRNVHGIRCVWMKTKRITIANALQDIWARDVLAPVCTYKYVQTFLLKSDKYYQLHMQLTTAKIVGTTIPFPYRRNSALNHIPRLNIYIGL